MESFHQFLRLQGRQRLHGRPDLFLRHQRHRLSSRRLLWVQYPYTPELRDCDTVNASSNSCFIRRRRSLLPTGQRHLFEFTANFSGFVVLRDAAQTNSIQKVRDSGLKSQGLGPCALNRAAQCSRIRYRWLNGRAGSCNRGFAHATPRAQGQPPTPGRGAAGKEPSLVDGQNRRSNCIQRHQTDAVADSAKPLSSSGLCSFYAEVLAQYVYLPLLAVKYTERLLH